MYEIGMKIRADKEKKEGRGAIHGYSYVTLWRRVGLEILWFYDMRFS
jgi:hypothetical protein